jgi:hypothetical protein
MPDPALRVDLAARDLVDRYLRYYKLNPLGSLAERCLRLQARFQAMAAARQVQLSACDRCGGQSDAALPACPFCGEGGLVGASIPASDGAVAPALAAPAVVADAEGGTPAERLARCMAELARCARAHRANLYTVGRLLRQIRDEELWRHRFDGRGQPLYTGYLAFVEAEVHVHRQQATKLIRCVEEFTAEQFEAWGASRLYFSLQLPEAERGRFLEQTRAVPCAQLVAEAARRRQPPDPAGPWARMPQGKRVVAAVPLGQVVARLYARPTRNYPVGVVTRDAVSLEDDPWTQVQITDDLWLRITLRRVADETGALAVGVEVRQGTLIPREDGK